MYRDREIVHLSQAAIISFKGDVVVVADHQFLSVELVLVGRYIQGVDERIRASCAG